MRVTMLVRCLAMMRGGGETRHLSWARELTALGVDASDPDPMLKMQADFRFVPRCREANDAVPRYAIKAMVVTLATGFAGYLLILLGWKP